MPNNLDFLNKFKEGSKYENINFFTSDFEDDIWEIKFKKKKNKRLIDFNILLQDQSCLTDFKNYKTLYTFKTLIMEFLLSDDMHMNSEDTIAMGLNGITHFIGLINTFDNDKSFSRYGFQSLDKDKMMAIMNSRLESNNLFYVYGGEDNLNKFLEKNELKKEEYTQNDIKNINSFVKEKGLDLQKEVFKYQFIPITFSLEKILLEKNKIEAHKTEHPGYFRTDSEMNKTSVISIINPFLKCLTVFNNMREIEDENLLLPFKENIDYILSYDFQSKDLKHFETYPIQVIFKVFKDSLDFHFNYGTDIVDSFLVFLDKLDAKNKSNDASKRPISKKTESDVNEIVMSSLQGKLKDFGVDGYSINSRDNYFDDLRNGKSLYSLLKVYYGCVQFVVGALMARRQSEINSMEVDCFDEINLQLNFRKSKSYQHSFGIRDYISLPAPEIVIEMVKNINRIAKRLDSGNETTRLFFIPKQHNPLYPNKCKKRIYENFDNMFDYFDVDLIDGKRPYIRQHQLRRFFAMAFFWSSGFKSIDTLRWFLGHTNAEHVYSYIKENTTGEILNNVKSQYISENIKDYGTLEEIFKNKYNIVDFNLIDKDDLSDYINSMLEDDLITIEPEFIEDDHGQQFDIIVKVKNND